MTEHYYAEFLYPGIIVSETSLKEITREEYLNPQTIKVPEHSFGFRVMHRNEDIKEDDVLIGQYRNTSGWYYIGVVNTKTDVARKDGKDSTLYRNMVNNGYDRIVRTRFGQAMPLRKEDVVLSEVL